MSRRMSLVCRLAVIAAVFVPHGVAELRGGAILLLLGWALVDLVSLVRCLYGRVSGWVLSSIDWSGPLTQPWRTPSMAELGARLGEAVARTAQAFGQLGTAYAAALGAFSTAYTAYRDNGADAAEEHANRFRED